MHIKTNTVFIYLVLFGYVFVLLCICFGKENSVAWQHRICAIRSIYIYIAIAQPFSTEEIPLDERPPKCLTELHLLFHVMFW